MTCTPSEGTQVVRGSSVPTWCRPCSQPASGARTMPSRSTPTGTPSARTTLAMPTRETLPSATSRGSRWSCPSGVRPEAGLSTPSTSKGLPGSGDMMVCNRVSAYGIALTSALHPRAEVGRGEVALEEDEQHHSRQGQDDGAGQCHAERVVLGRRRVVGVVRERDRKRLHGLLLGDQERPQELVPRADEGQQGCGQKRSEERRVGKECRSRWSPYH